jgi:hypothetical protein
MAARTRPQFLAAILGLPRRPGEGRVGWRCPTTWSPTERAFSGGCKRQLISGGSAWSRSPDRRDQLGSPGAVYHRPGAGFTHGRRFVDNVPVRPLGDADERA